MQLFLRAVNVNGDSVELLVEYIIPNTSSVYRTYTFRDGAALNTQILSGFIQQLTANTTALLTRADEIALLIGQDVIAFVLGAPNPNIKAILTEVHKNIDSVTLNVSIQIGIHPAFTKSIMCTSIGDISVENLNSIVMTEAQRMENLFHNANNVSSLLNTDLMLLTTG